MQLPSRPPTPLIPPTAQSQTSAPQWPRLPCWAASCAAAPRVNRPLTGRGQDWAGDAARFRAGGVSFLTPDPAAASIGSC